jgi:hypothetical protein
LENHQERNSQKIKLTDKGNWLIKRNTLAGHQWLVTQSLGPEFRPQHHKKQKNTLFLFLVGAVDELCGLDLGFKVPKLHFTDYETQSQAEMESLH